MGAYELFSGFYFPIIYKFNFIPYLLLVTSFVVIGIKDRYCGNFVYSFNPLLKSIQNLPVELKLLSFLILCASIGPITHPDAIDYHVGHPMQLFLSNRFETDGSLSWGVMGLSEWANKFFLIEQSSWLIRSVSATMIVPLVCFLNEKNLSKWLIILMVSPPVLIQWVTIGKPMFLYDLVIGVTLVCFIENKNSFNFKMLMAASILSVGFKITAVISVFLITAFILIKYFNDVKRCLQLTGINAFVLIITLSVTLATFHFRYFYFDNPFFPVLTSVFNPERPDYLLFTQSIFLYQKTVFLPPNFGSIGNILGPMILLSGVLVLANSFRLRKFDDLKFLGLAIFLCTLFFSQSRADYLFLPMFLFFLKFHPSALENRILSYLSIGQSLFTSIMLLISIYQSITLGLNFDKYMFRLAKGFELAKHASKQKKPVLIYNTRQPRLFMDYDYIDSDAFKLCVAGSTFSDCLKKNRIKTLYIQPPDLSEIQGNGKISCEGPILFPDAYRNPFNQSATKIYKCNHKLSE